MPNLGQPPIEQQYLAIGPDQYIFGLYVSMNHAMSVGVLECLSNLHHHLNQLPQVVTLTVVQYLAQGVAVNQLHREIQFALAVPADLIGWYSIWML